MAKLLYLSERTGSGPLDVASPDGRGRLAAALHEAGASRVQVNVVDDEVAPAAGRRIESSGRPLRSMVSVWVDGDDPDAFEAIDRVIAGWDPEAASYLVEEATPLAAPEVPPGHRQPGMAHIACFRRPEAQPVDEWLELWKGSHTQIAIDTQDTFGYVQHVVVEVRTPGATGWHAIVEECFPAAAMDDDHAFYDAVGDDERLARHRREMLASVTRFIDLSSIDVVPTGRYDLG
ncbi:MAG: EthD domain-containing protein [Acidimicrobiales bacterium]|nr:EthD domain-containing protein [Acidimicrobiales bacterium]